MKLIFLLGNIGAEYEGTRHNVAWAIATSRNLEWKAKIKMFAHVAEERHDSEVVMFVRPTTFYNLAGRSLRAVMDFYKLTIEDILVVHDDLMLPLGTVRTRIGGRDAGNNGLKSIASYLGSDNFARVRIGIATEMRERVGDTAFVLGRMNDQEREAIARITPKVNEYIDAFVSGKFEITTHRED